ncbi:MAG: DinB family protein [Bacteroidota bacterium]
MILSQLLEKLDIQTTELQELIQELSGPQLNLSPANGKWSIRMHLAHLGRYHEIFQMRLLKIMQEDLPMFIRYKSEWDTGFNPWKDLSTSEIWEKMEQIRREIKHKLNSLDVDKLSREGNHPLFGPMDVVAWFEFFTLHESHHIYSIFRIVKMRLWDLPEHQASAN